MSRRRCSAPSPIFILPFDFVPDMLPVLGFTDDAAVAGDRAWRLVASPRH